MSLKNKIQYYLEKNRYMTLQELENLCKNEQYKLSNAERRLREIMSTTAAIKPVKNSTGAIVAYRYESFNLEKWNSQFYPSKPQVENKQQTLI